MPTLNIAKRSDISNLDKHRPVWSMSHGKPSFKKHVRPRLRCRRLFILRIIILLIGFAKLCLVIRRHHDHYSLGRAKSDVKNLSYIRRALTGHGDSFSPVNRFESYSSKEAKHGFFDLLISAMNYEDFARIRWLSCHELPLCLFAHPYILCSKIPLLIPGLISSAMRSA